MKSQIRVEMDFNKKEPVLQIYLDKDSTELADQTLKHFVECANAEGMYIVWPYADDKNNLKPQIRLTAAIDPMPTDATQFYHDKVDEFAKFAYKYLSGSKEEKKGVEGFFKGLHHKIDLHPEI